MAGVTNKFEVGDPILRAEVNQNFTDLATLSSNITPGMVMDGAIFAQHIDATQGLKDFDSAIVTGVNITPIVGAQAVVGSNAGAYTPFSIVGNGDVVLVSAYAEVVLHNPIATATAPINVPNLSTLSIKIGAAADPPAILQGAGGVDQCQRTFDGLHMWGAANGPAFGYGQAAFIGDIGDPTFMLHLAWMFQATLPAVPTPQAITLYTTSGSLRPGVTITDAGLFVAVVKR